MSVEKILHLNVRGIYFDQINSGDKTHEYRLASKWLDRLKEKNFTKILIKKGYPKNTDTDRIIERPWRGYELKKIKHEHFGDKEVLVCAIRVNG